MVWMELEMASRNFGKVIQGKENFSDIASTQLHLKHSTAKVLEF